MYHLLMMIRYSTLLSTRRHLIGFSKLFQLIVRF